MRPIRFVLALCAALACTPAQAQFGAAWTKVPSVAVIGATDDPRQPLVDEAVSFWNGVLQEIGSPFRLGPVSPISLPNVARNVIAHEIGHAIGLGHNSDPAMLMCGRPAECRWGK